MKVILSGKHLVLVQLVRLLRLQLLDVRLHIGRQRPSLPRRHRQLRPQPLTVVNARLLLRCLLQRLLQRMQHVSSHSSVSIVCSSGTQLPSGADNDMRRVFWDWRARLLLGNSMCLHVGYLLRMLSCLLCSVQLGKQRLLRLLLLLLQYWLLWRL